VPNYKTGGLWVAISTEALWSTYSGTYHLGYPKANEVTGLGGPCGAFGKPTIHIQTPKMNGTGMGFWQAFFASSIAQSAAISIEVLNPSTGLSEKWAGTLKRPTFASVSWGATSAKSMYRDVKMEIIECVTTV
jgi:hypothetical protein